jgi:hypothetical protein
MTTRIRRSFPSVFAHAGIAIVAIVAGMLVDFSPAAPRQNVPATREVASGLARAGNQAVRPAASLSPQLAANYGKLPLGFEPNEGQSDGLVKFLSRGRGYSLFLTGNEAVLTFQKGASHQPNVRSVDPRVPRQPLVSGAALPGPLFLSSLKENPESEVEEPRDQRAGLAGPSALSLAGSRERSAVLRMRLVGANANAAVMGREELPGKSNYFIGSDSKKWRMNVPTFAKVNYHDVYPGVDLVYYGSQGGQLEYDFVLAPGADPAAILFGLSGGQREGGRQAAAGGGTQNQPTSQPKIQNVVSKIDASGDLVVKIAGDEVRFHKPVVYQSAIEGARRTSDLGLRTAVEGHYVLRAGNQVGFEVASYDHSRPLIIDPVLSYSTFLDGDGTDSLRGIAVDSAGNAYVTGWTTSADFPSTTGTLESANPGGTVAYVSKLNPTGTSLVYSTFLGDAGGSAQGFAIAVDPLGNAYITGATGAPFPTTVGAYKTTISGTAAYFVTKLNATGSALVYSTFFGPGSIEAIHLAVDPAGNVYLTGTTIPELAGGNEYAGTFPTTLGALEPSAPNPANFAAPAANSIPAGYPAPNPCYESSQFCQTAFVTKLNAAGSALVYSTYLGGYGSDEGEAIAADSSGNAYVTGDTTSYFWPGDITGSPANGGNFPTTAGAFQTAPPIPVPNCPNISGLPCYNGQVLYLNSGFVTKLNPTGSLAYSTFLGNAASTTGVGATSALGIAADGSGNAYITGYTQSTNFPTMNPLQGTCGSCSTGGYNAFVTKLNAAGSAPVYSTFLGGNGGDSGMAVAVDSAGEAYVTGRTTSTNFSTVNPFQATNQGGYLGYDVFVSELNAAGSALVSSSYLGGSADDSVAGIGVDSSGNAYVAGQTYSTNFPTTPGALQQTATAASCLEFPRGYIPFSSFITIENGVGGQVLFGQMTPAAYAALSSVPLPNEPYRNGFCESVEIYPGAYYQIAVPTAQERAGNFSDVGFQLTNPATQLPYLNNIISPPTSTPSTFAWVINHPPNPPGYNDYVAKISVNSAVSPSLPTLAFGTGDVGVPGSVATETVTNSGTDILTISKVAIEGANAGDFAMSDDSCTGVNIKPTDTCSVSVLFTPSGTGSRSASLEFIDNASNSPQTVALTGTGLSFIAVTLGPTTASVPLGHTDVFTSTITGTANLGLIWSVNGVVHGNAAQGTITGCTTVAPWTCNYKAPPVDVPNPNPAVIKVASAADPAIFATATATVTDHITVSVVPASATLRLNERRRIVTTHSNTSNTQVIWFVNGILNGNSAQGTLTACTASSCLYTVPSAKIPSPNPVIIKVESAADPTKFGTATIKVIP